MNKQKSIELLNKAIAEELSAIHQYMYFHFILDDLGYDLLAGIFKKTAIDEMLHTEKFAERILFLGGEIEMKPAHEVEHIRDVNEMLKWAMKSEEEAMEMYNDSAIECANARDAGTKQIFEAVIADEERHFEGFEQEFENLKKFGDRYLAQQAMERSKRMGMPEEN
ncbi:bacterioferritin [Caminibacter mediatlanticus TB-2]|uniref:Bacterioferritin n=1 Tax=Caminibacter mediatlanticus TB-2 TaxID=391592 RepID=A0ABX5V8P7_9BACT|nr:bacterioferritin [Caminibacter mediatlanticus]QCT94648.1 bacterioferritin [Caminibacter mediatlanticus TB-2]